MSLSNKFSGDISIPYTYSIQFKVSSVLLKPEFLLELYPRLAQILLHVEDSQTVVVVFKIFIYLFFFVVVTRNIEHNRKQTYILLFCLTVVSNQTVFLWRVGYRRSRTSDGPLAGIIFWSPCLTPTSSGLGENTQTHINVVGLSVSKMHKIIAHYRYLEMKAHE